MKNESNLNAVEESLQEGFFTVELTINSFLPVNNVTAESHNILKILPKNTLLVSVTPLVNAATISKTYQLKFYNPLMKSFKRVELDYQRHAERHGDYVQEFNLLTGIRYIRRAEYDVTPKIEKRQAHSCDIQGCAVCDPTDGL